MLSSSLLLLISHCIFSSCTINLCRIKTKFIQCGQHGGRPPRVCRHSVQNVLECSMFYGVLDVLERSREICNVLRTCKMFYTFKSESSTSFRMFYRSLGLLGQKFKDQFRYLTTSRNQTTNV